MFGLIDVIKLLPRDMFRELPKQVIVTQYEIVTVGGTTQNAPPKGPQQLRDAICVQPPHRRAAGRLLVSAFLAACFELLDVIFSGSHSLKQHLWRLLEAGSRREAAPSCPKRQLP